MRFIVRTLRLCPLFGDSLLQVGLGIGILLLPGGGLRDINRRLFTPGRHRNHRRRRSCFRRIGIGGNRKLTLPRSDLAPALRRLGFPRRLIGADLYGKGLRRRGRKGNRSLGTDRQSRLIRSRSVLLASRQQHCRQQERCKDFGFHTHFLLDESDFEIRHDKTQQPLVRVII